MIWDNLTHDDWILVIYGFAMISVFLLILAGATNKLPMVRGLF